MSALQYLNDNDIISNLEDYVLSAYLKKRQKDLEDSRSFHEENFHTNNHYNKGKHYLISDTITYIKQCYIFVDQDLSWQTVSVGERIKAYNQMVKYFI
jgi:hypothetical protein